MSSFKPNLSDLSAFFWIIAGSSCAAFGLKGFLLPNTFIDGGATGISLLIAETTTWDISLVILLVNVPFIVVGYWQMSKRFVAKTVFAILLLSLLLATVDFPIITNDKLLVAVFGGFFLGAGIGLSVRGGCVIDGTEILALHLSRIVGLSLGDMIMAINLVIFVASGVLLGVEAALYSMIAYFFASKTMDYIIQGIEEYLGVWVISKHSETIKDKMVNTYNMGVTVINGTGGYGKDGLSSDNYDILYTVVSRLEMQKVNNLLSTLDPKAFVIIQGVRDVKGGILRRRKMPV